ncbi:MAG: fused MFS/spermidine synthase [Deltaproteobacteria bacterium]|nr:fused MFS/spermidine synthase [Deltaproteobacteria bacterium]
MPPRIRESRANRVEVKRSGKGRALRIDGTFASWYEPGKAVTGSVWDALAAPLLLLPRSRRDRVLVLGLGAGSAARVARALAPRARITGIEIDVGVVRAARRWFDLDGLGIEVVKGDARHYLERTRRRFDVVLDDVFVGNRRTVRKPDWLPNPGLALARDRLRPGGILVSNTIDETVSVAREMRRLFDNTLRIEIEGYDNRVVVGAGFPLSGRALRAALARNPTLSATVPRFTIRKSRSR